MRPIYWARGRSVNAPCLRGRLACAVALPSAASWPSAHPDLRKPAGKEWLTIGGDWCNTRYSTLTQINRSNVKNLKGAWVVHLGSGLGAKYSLEGTPIVKDGVMYIATGNDDVFALDAKTGALIWEHRSGIDQNINTVCCGWDNRGVAIGDGKVFLGQLDGNFVALDAKTGKEVWKTQVGALAGRLHHHRAPLYHNGVIYTGISGGDRSARGFVVALDAKTGKEKWRFWTVPAPGEFGSDTWPKPDDPDPKRANAWKVGGAVGLADAGDRSRTRPDLFLDRQSRPGSRRHGPRPAGRQPVLVLDRGADARRQIRLALPAGASRPLGLRLPLAGRAVRPDLRRQDAQGHRGGLQDRLDLHPRPRQRKAADRHRREAGGGRRARRLRADAAASRAATR